ncbi:hypothetical protein N7509_000467 [Penicillium cosmopolitanum]|uniref:Uncharacterized protein n=1 Tax=Penicillium cosmopolitanum TaxID=1131564 RepID=A0A9X0BE78_9EURO|nr:uncharacterized protein N7509_000467 [Penicillium cosmopolitanum]KAJ5413840.1 hypothetical protein N7509_000467 [Penicillium cosmopolitanum]
MGRFLALHAQGLSSGALLDVELYILPIHLQMQQNIEETAIRIQTSPTWEQPATLRCRREPKERRLGGWCPLEALRWKKNEVLNALTPANGAWETRVAGVLRPWEPQITCVIEESAEEAIAAHDRIQRQLLDWGIERMLPPHLRAYQIPEQPPMEIFFTDGSGYQGHVGAAAVSLRPMGAEGSIYLNRYLGTTEDSTVYVAELNGVEMALAAFIKESQGGSQSTEGSRQSTGIWESSNQIKPPSKPLPIRSDPQANT